MKSKLSGSLSLETEVTPTYLKHCGEIAQAGYFGFFTSRHPGILFDELYNIYIYHYIYTLEIAHIRILDVAGTRDLTVPAGICTGCQSDGIIFCD